MPLTTLLAARMADSVYKAEISPKEYTSGPPPVAQGYAPQVWRHESASGFTGAIYTSQSTPHVVLAFAGTNPTSWGDIKADLAIAANQIPINQMEPANRLYIAAKQTARGREILCVGHSLGGGLAQFIAATYGLRAATFNAPAMGAHMERWNSFVGTRPIDEASLVNRIVNFRSLFDPVSIGLQTLDVVRRTVPVFGIATALDNTWARHLGRVVTLGAGAGLHGMEGMVAYIARQPWADQEPWEVR